MRPIRPGIVEGDLVVTRPFEECVITGRFDNSGHTRFYRLWRPLHLRLAPPSKGLEVERNWLSEASWCFQSVDLSRNARKHEIFIFF